MNRRCGREIGIYGKDFAIEIIKVRIELGEVILSICPERGIDIEEGTVIIKTSMAAGLDNVVYYGNKKENNTN